MMAESPTEIKDQDNLPEGNQKKGLVAWMKRLGWVAVLFFTLKGIGWLLVLYFGVEFFKGCN